MTGVRAQRLVERAGRLAAITARPGGCTRLAFSPELVQALELLRGWLEPLGVRCGLDAAANLSALLPGHDARAPRLALGSHLDTVVDGGAWDGALGVLVALDQLERLAGGEPRCDVELLAFADEEGVRFGGCCFGSRALVGTLDAAELERVDAHGVSLARALDGAGGDGAAVERVARPPGSIGAYLEVHIEQGPILERLGRPLALVSAIAGNSRAELRFEGVSGHAGTVPMAARQDAVAAAAAWTAEVERLAVGEHELVATVGRLAAHPGQVNVIAGSAEASLDVRAADDDQRRRVVARLRAEAQRQADARHLQVGWSETLDRPAVALDARLTDAACALLADGGHEPPQLISGAGHDAAAMAALCPTAMLLVRCRDGLSHHPDEHVNTADVAAALAATDRLVDDWLARWPPPT